MKNLFTLTLLLVVGITLHSCIKDAAINPIFSEVYIEFDAATFNAVTGNKAYPVFSALSNFGRAGTDINNPFKADSSTLQLRVNLVGKQFSTDQQIPVTAVQDSDVVKTNTLAIQGTDFAIGATVTIPAGSSFGYLNFIPIRRSTGKTAFVVLQLEDGAVVKAAPKYRRIGIRINQP